jgi:hypothetical protein
MSTVSASLGGRDVKAVFHTMIAPGASREGQMPSFAQCTNSRIPCSLTTKLEIFVRDAEVFIPRSAFADLGDVNTAALSIHGNVMVLTVQGGDSSEAYIAKLEFRNERVFKRSLYAAEDPSHPVEVSQFYMTSLNN